MEYNVLAILVSIHTPPWGRDINPSIKMVNRWFQFTRPRGGAITRLIVGTEQPSFNSHAPVGARFNGKPLVGGWIVSIHTPPWGRDDTKRNELLGELFQFTRPRGGAMMWTWPSQSSSSFNSHAPVGAR